MKRIAKLMVLCLVSTVLLFSCGGASKEKKVEDFINKLLAVETYNNISNLDNVQSDDDMKKLVDDLKNTFGSYFTDKVFEEFNADRVSLLYIEVLKDTKNITDIKLNKVSEKKNEGYTHMQYEVTYKLELKDKTVDMKDTLAFKVLDDKENLIDMFDVLGNSSIFDQYGKLINS